MSKRSTRLTNFLRPIDRRITAGGAAPRPAGALPRAVLFGERFVVSRALLHFERVERPAGRVDDRVRRAVELAARNRAPFADPGLHIVWGQRHAAAWSWDRTLLARLGVPEGAWVMPEPALAAPPREDGFRLRELHDGYEGQLVRQGELFASRFWPRRPSQQDIDLFVRACGVATDDADTAPAGTVDTLRIRVRDWTSRLTPLHTGLAVLLLVGVPLLYAAGSQARLSFDLHGARSQLQGVVAESSAQFDALRQYQANTRLLESYRAALDLAHPLAPAADLAEAAQAVGGRLERFQIAPGRVEAILGAGNDADPAEIVRRLENAPSLANVEIRRARTQGQWEVRAELVQLAGVQEDAA
ncbi:hypothetical protein [Maricaulis sp.]|uniref:hypothetical protein n=1 Tax=Maricaulis sp. TaxID=1486257 RepID=UPI00260ACA7D|nr:hypothetical protein [Maricaulis sp.]